METRITAVSIRDGKGRGAGTRIEEESGAVFSIWTGETVRDVPLNVAFAAPDLLEASKKFLAFYNHLAGSNPGLMGKLALQNYAQWNEAMMEMRRAIAKAERRQP